MVFSRVADDLGLFSPVISHENVGGDEKKFPAIRIRLLQKKLINGRGGEGEDYETHICIGLTNLRLSKNTFVNTS